MRSIKSLLVIWMVGMALVGRGVPPPAHNAQALSGSGVNILYAPAFNDIPSFRASVSAITGGTTQYWDAMTATPTLDDLLNYQCVFTGTYYSYTDHVAFGDVLANYVDAGGIVVLGLGVTYSGTPLSGRIMTPGYSPIRSTSGGNYFSNSSYNGDGSSLIWDGAATYSTNYLNKDIVLQGNGIADGTLDVGSGFATEIAAAYRPDYRVVWVNGLYGDTSLGHAQVLANACSMAAPLHLPGNYPNAGEVLIWRNAPAVPYALPGKYAQAFTLPADYDGNGFDTYIVTDTVVLDGETWYSIFMGGVNYLWVKASQVQVLR